MAVNCGVINKSGAWFAYNDSKIGQGRENSKQYLKDNPEIMEEVERKVREHYGISPDGVMKVAAAPAGDEEKFSEDEE